MCVHTYMKVHIYTYTFSTPLVPSPCKVRPVLYLVWRLSRGGVDWILLSNKTLRVYCWYSAGEKCQVCSCMNYTICIIVYSLYIRVYAWNASKLPETGLVAWSQIEAPHLQLDHPSPPISNKTYNERQGRVHPSSTVLEQCSLTSVTVYSSDHSLLDW